MGSGSQDRTSPALAGDPRQLWSVGSTAQPLPCLPAQGWAWPRGLRGWLAVTRSDLKRQGVGLVPYLGDVFSSAQCFQKQRAGNPQSHPRWKIGRDLQELLPWARANIPALGILGVMLRRGETDTCADTGPVSVVLCHCRQIKPGPSAEEFGCDGGAGGGRRGLLPALQGFDASCHSVCSWKTFSELLAACGEAAAHCGVSSEIQNSSSSPRFQCSISGPWGTGSGMDWPCPVLIWGL